MTASTGSTTSYRTQPWPYTPRRTAHFPAAQIPLHREHCRSDPDENASSRATSATRRTNPPKPRRRRVVLVLPQNQAEKGPSKWLKSFRMNKFLVIVLDNTNRIITLQKQWYGGAHACRHPNHNIFSDLRSSQAKLRVSGPLKTAFYSPDSPYPRSSQIARIADPLALNKSETKLRAEASLNRIDSAGRVPH